MPSANRTANTLHEAITAAVNLEELKSLCFDLNVNPEHLPGDTLPGKVRELLQYLDRQGRTAELLPHLQTLRPLISWHTFQPAEPNAASPFTKLLYNGVPSNNLPPLGGKFIGRDYILKQVKELLKKNVSPLVLEGAPGMGKGALANIVAHYGLKHDLFEKVVWWSADYQSQPLAVLLDEIGRVIGHRIESGQPSYTNNDNAYSLLRQHKCLLVIAKVTARQHQEILDFLSNVPRPTCVLLTTTAPMVWAVKVIKILPLNDLDSLKLIRHRARELAFTELAKAEDTELRPLIEACSGLPLAIIIAVSLAKKGIHLNRIISMLQQGMGDFSELCAKAYAQLSEEARVVLNLICISRESISGDALQTVLENLHHISRQTVEEDLLQQIRDLGLIEEQYVLRWTNSRFFPASRLVREYYNGTIRALRPEEDHRLRSALASYYKEQCELKGRENWSEHSWLEQNLREIFATIEWYDHTQQGSSLVQLIKHIYYFLGVRGYWRERLIYGDRAGQAARELGDFQSEAEILVRVIGHIEIQLGEYVKAEEDILRGLKKFEELNDNGGIASAYRYLGSLERRRGNYDKAEDYYEKALSHAQLASDSERLIAGIKISLSTMHFKRQKIKECEQQLQEALDIFERLDHISKVTEAKSRLADVKFRQGQYIEARKLYLESEEDAKRIGRKKTSGYNYLGLARIAQVQGEHTVAADYACKARELFGNLGLADEGSEVADLFDLCRQ